MSSVNYRFFMSQIKYIEEIKDTDKTTISHVMYAGVQAPCVLRVCKNRDLSELCGFLINLRHPNIVSVHDFLYENGNTYIIEELVVGKNLQETLDECGTFSEKEVVQIVQGICLGLEVLHANKPAIVHNDIKPANIILRADGTVKLIDFDISRVYKEKADRNTRLMGTEEYASPEHFGFGQSEPCTDVYSLGVTMHELLTGSRLTKEHKITYNGYLKRIIKKCVEVDRDKRYLDAHALRIDIEKYSNNKKRKKFLWVVCFLIVVLILGIVENLDTDDGESNDENKELNIEKVESGSVEVNEASEFIDSELEVNESSDTEKDTQIDTEISESEKTPEMKNVYMVEGTLHSMSVFDKNTLVALEENDGKFFIHDSNGVTKELKGIYGQRGINFAYNGYTDKLFLLDYTEYETIIYLINSNYELTEQGRIENYNLHDLSRHNNNFLANGNLLCNAMGPVVGCRIDSNTWRKLGEGPTPEFVINDRLFETGSDGTIREINYNEEVINQYKVKSDGWEILYEAGLCVYNNSAYFIDSIQNKDYLYKFDGNEISSEICLSDYMFYNEIINKGLCVCEDKVWCFDLRSKWIVQFDF